MRAARLGRPHRRLSPGETDVSFPPSGFSQFQGRLDDIIAIMANRLKFVGNTPICEAGYLQRIDAVCMTGAAPHGFWKDIAHRRDYLIWLADRHSFCVRADLYRLELTPERMRIYRSGLKSRFTT
jgi:hypothetical protein